MNIELIINNIGFVLSLFLTIGIGIFVYVRRPKEKASLNIIFLLYTIVFGIWQVSYLIGTNLHDPLWSRFAFIFNLSTLFAVIFSVHMILLISGRFERQKNFITFLYLVAGAFVVFFAFNPDLLLLPSQPQLYFPNFFVQGPFYFTQDTFFMFVLVYFFIETITSYYRADSQTRNKIKYFFVGILGAYIVAVIPEFLMYGIIVDPIVASLSGLGMIPMAYAIIEYDLVYIDMIAKRAFIYTFGTVGITFFILFIGYANDTIAFIIPGFPQWILPFLSGVLGVAVGIFVWKKIQEVDYLKFQFVDVVTHKFRTPLTHIKWSAEVLRSESDPKERMSAISAIEEANIRLFEMTNSLIGLSRSNENQYQYIYAAENIVDMLNETLATIENQIKTKRIIIKMNISDKLPTVFVDRKRVQFVMQMIIENAVIYSPQGSAVEISIEQHKTSLYFSVHDMGIGISKEDMVHLFTRFFRGSNAAQAHTEGLGIGLFVAKDIMKRHGGDLWAESIGLGKGSTFFLKIPLEK